MLELIGVDGLTQWDVGRQVKVDKDVDMVHFSNRPYGYSKNVKVTDGVVDVPDMFLTSCAPLHIWAYIGNFEKGYTKIEKIYEIKPKNRPEDYIYTPEDVKTWEKLQSEIGDLAGLETKAKENLVAAVNEAAKSGENDYEKLTNLPQINGVVLMGNKTGEELGLVPDLSGFATKDEIPVVPPSIPNPHALTFTGAVNAVYDGSSAVSVEIPSGGSGGTDISLGLTSASVGQIIKVKAVDESGKPTEWEAAEEKTLKWIKVHESTLTENTNIISVGADESGKEIQEYNPIGIALVVSTPADATQTNNNGQVWAYPQKDMVDNTIRIISTIAGWKTVERDSIWIWQGGSTALAYNSNNNNNGASPVYKVNNYAMNGVYAYIPDTKDHFPVGSTVLVSVLTEM